MIPTIDSWNEFLDIAFSAPIFCKLIERIKRISKICFSDVLSAQSVYLVSIWQPIHHHVIAKFCAAYGMPSRSYLRPPELAIRFHYDSDRPQPKEKRGHRITRKHSELSTE